MDERLKRLAAEVAEVSRIVRHGFFTALGSGAPANSSALIEALTSAPRLPHADKVALFRALSELRLGLSSLRQDSDGAPTRRQWAAALEDALASLFGNVFLQQVEEAASNGTQLHRFGEKGFLTECALALHPWDRLEQRLLALDSAANPTARLKAAHRSGAAGIDLAAGERLLDMELFYKKFPMKKGTKDSVRKDRSKFLGVKNKMRSVGRNQWAGPDSTCRKLEGR